MVLLPKPKGGMRPLGLTSVMWRLGMSIVNTQLAGWAASWFPKELVGALTGRQAAYIHRRVRAALSTAEHFGAVAQDLSKAFDTIDPMVAAAIMRRIGLLDGIINCWLEFHRKAPRFSGTGRATLRLGTK